MNTIAERNQLIRAEVTKNLDIPSDLTNLIGSFIGDPVHMCDDDKFKDLDDLRTLKPGDVFAICHWGYTLYRTVKVCNVIIKVELLDSVPSMEFDYVTFDRELSTNVNETVSRLKIADIEYYGRCRLAPGINTFSISEHFYNHRSYLNGNQRRAIESAASARAKESTARWYESHPDANRGEHDFLSRRS